LGNQSFESSDADWQVLLQEQVRANGALLHSIARRLLRDRTSAEDVCQKAMLSAWSRRQDLRTTSGLRAWLTTTVVNESLAVLRRRKVERRAMQLAASDRGVSGGGRSPSDQLGLRAAVVDALAGLDERERTVVALRLMQGLSGVEAARFLGLSEAQVSKLLHRGMERLRDVLREWDEPPK
jgi:RNA polymerase sigma-70 factor (ECF subfamily)